MQQVHAWQASGDRSYFNHNHITHSTRHQDSSLAHWPHFCLDVLILLLLMSHPPCSALLAAACTLHLFFMGQAVDTGHGRWMGPCCQIHTYMCEVTRWAGVTLMSIAFAIRLQLLLFCSAIVIVMSGRLRAVSSYDCSSSMEVCGRCAWFQQAVACTWCAQVPFAGTFAFEQSHFPH